VAERPMSKTRTFPKDSKDITIVDILNMIQEIPVALLQTPQGVALISLLSGVLLEQSGFSNLVFKLKPNLFLDQANMDKLSKFPSENAYCLSLSSSDRSIQCEMKPKLNVKFDLWPWKGGLFGIQPEFGEVDLPVPKLLILLGSMGLSAEFLKGLGGIVPG